ncbi:glutamine amidotransferase [Microbacterium oryzae]|uniref:glutamine amidotransferase n=1 Tax=Microbacterium oryzae TaxID=743009 RepID=UPI0025AFDA6C|nr:glutamine amidotransferase [Microbacterium oryzae]MDN3310183.1 glutamine amidotransferase [Microbacterium oryzae]
MARILIAGESWLTTSTHTKGVDAFTLHSYVEGVAQLRTALEAGGHEVVHMPGHLVPSDFPETPEQLAAFDAIILSDIGANSVQLAPDVIERSIPGRDRLQELAAWVTRGGGLIMIGGYLSFTGFQALAAYRETDLAPVLPVEMLVGDDRVERPAGVAPTVLDATHPALGSAGATWPALLGYNRTITKEGATTLATMGDDPLVTVWEIGEGRSAVFTSDCSPHWAPPAFCDEWSGYTALFNGIVGWVTGRS